MPATEIERGGSGQAKRPSLAQLQAHLEALRLNRRELRDRLAALHVVDSSDGDETDRATENWAEIESSMTEQFQRAAALRHELAETARSIARVEDEVAAVLEWLATTSPDRAEWRLTLAKRARENAALERARAAEFDQ